MWYFIQKLYLSENEVHTLLVFVVLFAMKTVLSNSHHIGRQQDIQNHQCWKDVWGRLGMSNSEILPQICGTHSPVSLFRIKLHIFKWPWGWPAQGNMILHVTPLRWMDDLSFLDLGWLTWIKKSLWSLLWNHKIGLKTRVLQCVSHFKMLVRIKS